MNMEARDGLGFAICRAALDGLLMVRMSVFTYSLYLVRETDGCIVFQLLTAFIHSDFQIHFRLSSPS